MKTSGLFYRKKPLFGFDIGNGSIKVVQLHRSGKKILLEGYGSIFFDPRAIKDGVISDFKTVSQAAHDLVTKNLTGTVTTNRIAASLPVLNSYSRIINLPHMEDKDVVEAVRMEAEQYIPMPISDVYLDYQLVESSADSQDYLVSAAPKRVVDSYTLLFNSLGLELMCLEPSILSVTRTVQNAEKSNLPTLVIDCGSTTTDLIIYNKSSVRITGTIKFGGNGITQSIMNSLGVSHEEANRLKNSEGLDPGKKQAEILDAINQDLHFLTSEIKKMIRYFEERDKDQNMKVEQIILLGGGANLPGFATYLTSQLRIPTRLASIWHNISKEHIIPPGKEDTSMYATAAGLALIKPEEVVA